MEAALVLMGYFWIVAGLLWILDHIPAYKGDKERYFKTKEDK